MSEAVANEPGNMTIEELKERVAFYEGRRDTLKEDLLAHVQRKESLELKVQAAQESFTAGEGSAKDVAALRAELEEELAAADPIHRAQVEVDTLLQEYLKPLKLAEQREETRRQEKAVEPLRKRAGDLVDEFASCLVRMHAILAERKALTEKVAAEYPLAKPLPLVTVDDLTAAILVAWPKDRAMKDVTVEHWRRWVDDRLLAILVTGDLAYQGTRPRSVARAELGVAH